VEALLAIKADWRATPEWSPALRCLITDVFDEPDENAFRDKLAVLDLLHSDWRSSQAALEAARGESLVDLGYTVARSGGETPLAEIRS